MGTNPESNGAQQKTCLTAGFWYARLDSNQRPTESELSGRQAGKPCGARAWLVLHKFPPLWRKTSEALSDRASEVFLDSRQIVVCAPDVATLVFIILTTSLFVPLLYSTQRKDSPIQPCQKSAFCVHFACAIMPLSTVRRFAPPYQDAPKPVYTPTFQIFKSSISCVSTSAYCSAWRFGFPDESSST